MRLAQARHVHLIGVGGIGLSAIAQILLARGLEVSGSDTAPNEMTARLAQQGATIYTGHHAENIRGADLVVASSAVNAQNAEIAAAQAQGLRVVDRHEFLGELTEGYRVMAVAGSHGKTTTTALLGLMLRDAGLDPTLMVGGVVPELDSNARAGRGEYFVIEADEYGYAFLGLRPYLALVTNVDYDHPDLFATREAYVSTFAQFVSQTRDDGAVVVCGDDAGARASAGEGPRARVITYGRGEDNVWRATEIRVNEYGGNDFVVRRESESVGELQTRIPGTHNVLNALGAYVAAQRAGVSFEHARDTVARFGGVGRRFEILGTVKGVTLVDDYAHHPSEIRATLAAARERFPARELWVVFQPHTFTRTRALLVDFARAFEDADHVMVTEIYASREREDVGMSGREIVARMRHRDARFIANLDDVVETLAQSLTPGVVLLTLGAGDVNRVGQQLLNRIERAEVETGETRFR